MKEVLQTIFGLLGGLAVFIFGMNMMSECLQKVAGEKMKKILALLTKNPVLGVIAGALTTAVLQSSSATTVMAIGFVSAGLMTLPQAISIILGANIGTTITAQIIAFKITDYIYAFIFVGFIIYFLAKSEKLKNIGQTLFAFGLLFLGIETMGSVMKPLASSPVFTDMIAKVAGIPVLGVAVGTLMTLVVQSSSATIAVLQNFASQAGADGVTSILGLTGAIPILLGDNIGTTITALLASVGQPKNAKRTAVAHCIFNISGCLLFIWFIPFFAEFIRWISPKGPEIEVISRQIANAHTTFNVVMTLIWMPLIWLMVKIVMKLIPDQKYGEKDTNKPIYLDDKLISQPAAALHLVSKEIIHCGDIVGEILLDTIDAVKEGGKKQLELIVEKVAVARSLNDDITEYLAELFASGVLTEEQATQTAGIMHVLSDIDRIGSLNSEIADNLKANMERKKKYSKDALKNLQNALSMIEEMYSGALHIMKNEPGITDILNKKENVLDIDIDMRKGHMKRVAKGKCDANLTASFNSILHIIDRMGNNCVNIAEAVTGPVSFDYFTSLDKQ
ncbi:MAG: Na/Pi cotransporter family protein [bacterium]|nr:Na/Pi cotransporter family protein [bacterium]